MTSIAVKISPKAFAAVQKALGKEIHYLDVKEDNRSYRCISLTTKGHDAPIELILTIFESPNE